MHPVRLFACAFVAVFVTTSAWSLATPLFASPDEPSHVARAVALDHGQLIGNKVGHALVYTTVTVPGSIADGDRYVSCFAFKSYAPASCAHSLSSSQKPKSIEISSGRYPPLYFAIVGLPSLASTSATGVYVMRLTSALLSSLFIALAFMAVGAWSRRPLLSVGILLALTPMVVFMASVVNPNGLEISAAICLWTSGVILATERADDPPAGLLATVAGAATVLMLCRGISPLWVFVIFAVLAVLAGRRGIVAVARTRGARVAAGVIVLSGVAALWWIAAAHANVLRNIGGLPPRLSNVSVAATSLGQSTAWIHQMVGVFGWLDTSAPYFTYVVWYAAVGFVLVLAFAVARLRPAASLLLLVVAVVVVPVAILEHDAHQLGEFWQGRYTLPLAVGLPIVATSLIEGTDVLARFRMRVTVLVAAVLGAASFAAFFNAERRYASGLPGPIGFEHASWNPPLGNVVMALWALVGSLLFVALVIGIVGAATWTTRERRPDRPDERPAPITAVAGPA